MIPVPLFFFLKNLWLRCQQYEKINRQKLGAMKGGHYTTGRTNKKESELVHNVQGMYKKAMRILKGKTRKMGDYPSVIQ